MTQQSSPDIVERLREALREIAKEVYTDGTPTKAARTALAALRSPDVAAGSPVSRPLQQTIDNTKDGQ